MPDGMPGTFSKGGLLRAAEATLNQFENRAALYEAIRSSKDLASLFPKEASVRFDRVFKDHLANDVFVFGGMWTDKPDKDRIVLEALALALEKAGIHSAPKVATGAFEPGKEKARAKKVAAQLPIELFWICAGNRFNAAVTRNERQVGVYFMTPPPPANFFAVPTPLQEEIWQVVDSKGALVIVDEGAMPIGHGDGTPASSTVPPPPRPASQRPQLVRSVVEVCVDDDETEVVLQQDGAFVTIGADAGADGDVRVQKIHGQKRFGEVVREFVKIYQNVTGPEGERGGA